MTILFPFSSMYNLEELFFEIFCKKKFNWIFILRMRQLENNILFDGFEKFDWIFFFNCSKL